MNDKILVKYLRLFFRRKKRNIIKYYKNSINRLRIKKKNFFLFKKFFNRQVNKRLRTKKSFNRQVNKKRLFNNKFKYVLKFNKFKIDNIYSVLRNNKYLNKNKKLSFFIPKTFSSLTLYRKKLYSQYFSKWNYSYYLTDKKKTKKLNKSSLFNYGYIMKNYSNTYLLYLEYYILIFLKRVFLIFDNNLSLNIKLINILYY